ncbi:enoyl-CoA hydratase/isomerase family protein [Luteimonas fraxinea]|uniref:Enoyl-CoA hydratase/isomerase family protein n=1 Tax=Luteimonas fraxinea TaxID=2901869 RepID=A0ABS8UAE3_9GAMM|nr:enoyl-CoA hydratase/isomerase family protein [Luteimonas fraxinea]MCD9096465.1 enoyl-CoA hydratase/isomerase family protein [Luteimonas fraxinea]MCD9125806.1 enoyl-CoA hydratase/isomerase family protein [Luteimonas fraxinea]UHH10093.1 enoyl-CoA hydratase/isomerase family protein [Luteimonas fraxinea]
MGIAYDVSDGIAMIRFNRPDKLNALTLSMYRELGDAFIAARDDTRVRVVILTASGQRAFCVGADLGESIPALMDDTFDISQWDDAHLKNLQLYKPVLCAINGLCLGGGFEIMLGTDIRIAADHAKFALPEPSLGIVPAGGTLVRLVRQVPYVHAMELLLTANGFSAQELLAKGLLNRVVPIAELMPQTLALAERIKAMSPGALAVIKESVQRLVDLPERDAFAEEARLGQRAFTSADARRGLAAFAQRQTPVFD